LSEIPNPIRRRGIDIIESHTKTKQYREIVISCKRIPEVMAVVRKKFAVSNSSHKGMGSRRIPIK
jgi:hypothetical protein